VLRPEVADDRHVGGHFSRFAGFPAFFFDLEPVLAHTDSALSRDAGRLRCVCEQHLGSLGASDVLMFSGSGFYLIVLSGSGTAALKLANLINLSLLRLFFGADSPVPRQLRTMFQKVTLGASTSSHRGSSVLDPAPVEELGAPAMDEDVPDISGEERQALVHLAAHGKLPEKNIALTFVPVHNLRRHRVRAFFCSPASSVGGAARVYGYGAFQNMSRHKLPFVDRAILSYAVKFARKLSVGGVAAAIGTSVHFETLAWSKGRKIYYQALRAMGISDFPFLFLKVEGVPAGIQPGRLADIVSVVRPLAKRVFVHLPDCDTPGHQSGHLGASGLVLSLPPRPTPATVTGASTWLVRACEAQTAFSCVERIDSDATLELVRLAGVRFGIGHVFGAQEFCGDAEPAAVEAFMNRVAA
jgi:hypothetical protein